MKAVGTPSACFLPAAKHEFEYVTGTTTVSVPIRGTYPEDAPTQGAFDICPENGVVLFGTLLEALFGFNVYPELKENQKFVLLGLDIDDTEVKVVGRVIEFTEK